MLKGGSSQSGAEKRRSAGAGSATDQGSEFRIRKHQRVGKSIGTARGLASERKLLAGRHRQMQLPIGKSQRQCGRRNTAGEARDGRMHRTIDLFRDRRRRK